MLYKPPFEIIIPFLQLNNNKLIYLEVYRRFFNQFHGFFGDDMSYFTHFPFKSKEILMRIKYERY
jgi:hypothetical protein